MLHWMIENTVITAVLAVGVAVICKLNPRRPTLCHMLWLLLMLRLVLPPLPLPSLSPVLLSTFSAGGQHLSEVFLGAPGVQIQETGPALVHAMVDRHEAETGLANRPATPSPQQTDATRPARSYGFFFMFCWFMGGILVLYPQIIRIRRFQGAFEYGTEAPDHLAREVAEVATRLNMAVPRILVLPNIESPLIWSLTKPQLLWPAHTADQPSCPGTRSILAHELAHVRRKDHLVSWFVMVCMALFWWHPLFWLAYNRIRYYAELACDAWAVWAYPNHRRVYAEALLDASSPGSPQHSSVVALAATHSQRRYFKKRLTMIMRRGNSPKIPPFWIFAVLAMMLLVLPSMTRGGGSPSRTGATEKIDEAIRFHALQGQAHEAMERELWPKAIAALEELSELNGGFHTQMNLARAYAKAGRDLEAIGQYEEVIEAGNHLVESHVNLAAIHAGQNKTASLDHLEKALAAGFSDAESLMADAFSPIADEPLFYDLLKQVWRNKHLKDMAKRATSRQNWHEAVSGFSELLAAAPNYREGYAGLVYAQIRGGYLDEASITLQTQIDLNYRVDTAHYNMACVSALQGESNAALKHLSKAIELGFSDQKLIEIDPDLESIRGHDTYAAMIAGFNGQNHLERKFKRAMGSGHLSKCETIIAELAETGHQHIGAMYEELALALTRKGDYAGAVRAFEDQLISGPGDMGRTLYNIACANALLGDTEQAFSFLENALSAGFLSMNHIANDKDLSSLKHDPRFADILARAKQSRTAPRGHAENQHESALQKILIKKMPMVVDHILTRNHHKSTENHHDSLEHHRQEN